MLEKLPISYKLRTEVHKQIGTGELIKWAGQPIRLSFTESCIKPILFGIALTIISLYSGYLFFSLLFGYYLPGNSITLYVISFLVFPYSFIYALYFFYIPIKNWEERQTVYLITNQRAIKICCGIKSCSVSSYLPSQLKDISLRERKDGSGDIIFGSYLAWEDFETNATYYKEYGFMKIRNVLPVEKMLRYLAQNESNDTYN